MTGLNVKIWMMQNSITAREIATGHDCHESFVSKFLKGKKTSKGLVTYLIDEGCPKENFKNGKVTAETAK